LVVASVPPSVPKPPSFEIGNFVHYSDNPSAKPENRLPDASANKGPANKENPGQTPATETVALPPLTPPEPWQAPEPLYTPLAAVPLWTPDLELLTFGAAGDVWTLRDACEGVFVLGATGSGKSTGSGRALARAFLANGFGGLILTVKPDECQQWEAMARAMGREQQLCVIRPGAPYHLNFLDYESRRPGGGAGLIENLVNLFHSIIDVRAHGMGDVREQNFWTLSGKQLIRNTFRILKPATSRLSLADAARLITESPKRTSRKPDAPVVKGPHFTAWMERALHAAKGTSQERVMEECRRYWEEEFLDLAPDTRSCIVALFSSMADTFIEPAIHDLFCTDTTLIPEAVLEGALIIVDLPLKNYDAVGLFAQSIWKHLFQKAIERREDPEDDSRRPVFLWIDEAQYFFSSYDGLFQSTARSARCATVYLTQNISNFYGLSQTRAKERVDGFLGNLNTKIFHCNNDPASNLWAAEQIGRYQTQRFGGSISEQPPDARDGIWGWFKRRSTSSASFQETMDYAVQPSAFLNLRTGGERFDYLVDAYFVKGGATFSATGRHYFATTFQQEFLC
jgi:hypothetical protein